MQTVEKSTMKRYRREDSPENETRERKKRRMGKKLVDKYKEQVDAADQTTPDVDVEKEVENRISRSIKKMTNEFKIDIGTFMKLFSPENIKKTVTDIVITDINKPLRGIIYTYLLHYKTLEKMTKERSKPGRKEITFAEELTQLDPPGENEPPFSDFVETLQCIMTKVIEKVVGAIENKKIFSDNNTFASSFLLKKINLPPNIKTKICSHLFDEICLFAGEVFYSFFMDDKKIIKEIINIYI